MLNETETSYRTGGIYCSKYRFCMLFSRLNCLMFLDNQGWSLSSDVTVSWITYLDIISFIIALNILIFSFTLFLSKLLSHEHSIFALLMWSTLAFAQCQFCRWYGGGWIIFRLNFLYVIWSWQFEYNEECTLNFINKDVFIQIGTL